MSFWVILIITYGGMLDGQVAYVPLPSQEACEAAMDLMWETTMKDMPDGMLQCMATDTPSKIVRPRLRPLDLGVSK